MNKPELIIDERLVRECAESAQPPKWDPDVQKGGAGEPNKDRQRNKSQYKKPEKATVKERPKVEVVLEVEDEAEEEPQRDDSFGAAPG